MSNHPLSPPVFPCAWASDWGEDYHGLWMALTYKEVRHVFRWIEPGSFRMGTPATEKGRYDTEDQHQVTLSKGFWLGETTVTQALWQAVMGDNPSEFQGPERPVEQVSWEDCQRFIESFNALHDQLNARLPTDAQWEYACRAGTPTAFHFGDEIALDRCSYRGTWDDWTNWGEGALKATADVRSYPCNRWGLYEMHGNVWEWCDDWFEEHLGHEPVADPEGPASGTDRVLRGGSWFDFGRNARSAFRIRDTPDYRGHDFGFRLSLGL